MAAPVQRARAVRGAPTTRVRLPPSPPAAGGRSLAPIVTMPASTHPLRAPHRPAPAGAAYDVVVVGGGPAGLGAALVLGRARLRALVLDSGRPANARSPQVGGLLGGRRVTPEELRQRRARPAGRPTRPWTSPTARCGHRRRPAAASRCASPAARRPSAPTRCSWRTGCATSTPTSPGWPSCGDRSALHCPFCDGWEVRDLPVAVLGSGPAGARLARRSPRVGAPTSCSAPTGRGLADERAGLERAGVRVREEPVRAAGRPRWPARADRVRRRPCRGARRDLRPAGVGQPNDLAERSAAGCRDDGTIPSTDGGRTGVPGVYAAGDAATPSVRSVALAIGSGTRVGASLVLDLTAQAAA